MWMSSIAKVLSVTCVVKYKGIFPAKQFPKSVVLSREVCSCRSVPVDCWNYFIIYTWSKEWKSQSNPCHLWIDLTCISSIACIVDLIPSTFCFTQAVASAATNTLAGNCGRPDCLLLRKHSPSLQNKTLWSQVRINTVNSYLLLRNLNFALLGI